MERTLFGNWFIATEDDYVYTSLIREWKRDGTLDTFVIGNPNTFSIGILGQLGHSDDICCHGHELYGLCNEAISGHIGYGPFNPQHSLIENQSYE